ncbi:MAG: 23S rRNA (guanosine(2251)-2'-O)-methyltransferase RlmB [Schleiferiaceae bacterium]|jgi:23S rRNA (guanosine2251-2'-O)-methyltransferase|tara:strand:+ start:966 stop:1697 length:732 start_codon:yes stop_codon:yes gene_type:complete
MNETMIYGVHPVLEALNSGKEVDRIFIVRGRSENIDPIIEIAKSNGVTFKIVPVEKMNRLTRKNHQGVIAFLSPIVFSSLENIIDLTYSAGETPLILVLDRITDVRNIGAIARSAEGSGVQAIVIPKNNSAPINGDAVKSSAGALLRVPICKEKNLSHTLSYLEESGLQIIGCSEKANSYISDINFSNPSAIVLGSEEDGISSSVWKGCNIHAKIPMVGDLASLNVSVAAGIILYESVRQKNQ